MWNYEKSWNIIENLVVSISVLILIFFNYNYITDIYLVLLICINTQATELSHYYSS
jgi:hypothetical protein